MPVSTHILRGIALPLLLLLVAPTAVEAQTAGPRPNAARHAGPRPMRFERLSIDQGLSQNTVTAILQDRTGFLWLGTQDGLNRYDGYGFEVYRSAVDDPATLGADWILNLAEDPSGDLWIGTEGGGLARWRRATDTFIRYRHDPEDPASLSGDRVAVITRDRSGALWVGTFESGLSRLAATNRPPAGAPRQDLPGTAPPAVPVAGVFERFRYHPDDPASLSDDRVRAVLEDRRGNLWIGTLGGLNRYDTERGAFVRYRHRPGDPLSLSDDRVRAIAEDADGDLWIGTEGGGLNRLPGGAGDRFERFRHDPAERDGLSHDWVRALFTDRDGRLWIGTDGGLNLWRGNDRRSAETSDRGRFASYRHDPGNPASLSSDQVLTISQDQSGLLWVGTLGGGLSKWNPGTWSFGHDAGDPAWIRPSAAGGSSLNVFAISEDRDGILWVGRLGSGLERLDRRSGERSHFRHRPGDGGSLGDDRVTALLHDRRGILWVGTYGGGLNRMAGPAAVAFERYLHDPGRPDSLSTDSVTTLFEDRQGRLWVGTYGGGLNLHLGGGAFQPFRHQSDDEQSLSHDRPMSIAEDGDGRLWVATDGGGLNRFHAVTEAFLRIGHDPADPGSLASDELNAVHVDPSGQLWVGTKGAGLDRLESLDEALGRAVFRNYSRADGLPAETILGIRSEAGGALWLSTNNGLSRFDPENRTFKNYNASHGLQSKEFNLGAHYQSSSGELFFGGVNGLNAFYPDQIEANSHVPPVVLTSFTKINQPVRFERPVFDVERIELTHRDYSFSFELAALDFTAPERNRYRYRLEGFDDGWIENGTRRWVTFTNLDPGGYRLRVQGSNNDRLWNEAGASIAVAVAPPPWRTWWAYTLYALGFLAVVGGGALTVSQRRKAERDRLVAERDRAIAEHERQAADRERRQVTERERLIGEREELSGERERLIAELGEKNTELERFNYTVSHDLKSPLVTVKGFLGLLERDLDRGDRERIAHDIERIGAAADKMTALLDELLKLSRIDHREGEPVEIDLGKLAAEALELLHTRIEERGVEVEVAPDLPVVAGDRLQLFEVYQNLLSNAVQYLGDQEAPQVEVGVRTVPGVGGGSEQVFFVHDNGIGVEERFHHQIFGLFERLETGEEGTGIGLAVVKRIVERHGGRVWVESEGRGHGSTFCFTLGGEETTR